MENIATATPPSLSGLLRYLEQDPANTSLLADAAAAAFDDGNAELSASLIRRHAAIKELSPALRNFEGLIALREQRYQDAAAIFSTLRSKQDTPALRFNLAWALSMSGDFDGALALLDDAALASSPRAPVLKIRVLHHLGQLEEALADGAVLLERNPSDRMLVGALATLAMDAQRPDLALAYAKAADNDEGHVVLGMLELTENPDDATARFDQALTRQPGDARAWIGKGLGLLIAGKAAEGAQAIDHGAGLFGDHIGSWVASGWAHVIAGNHNTARASFQRALELDANFAESHGGLAVLDLTEGRLDEGRKRAQTALRLDSRSFGGALAQILLLKQAGRDQSAQKILEAAMATPVGPNGQTLAQALASLGGRARG